MRHSFWATSCRCEKSLLIIAKIHKSEEPTLPGSTPLLHLTLDTRLPHPGVTSTPLLSHIIVHEQEKGNSKQDLSPTPKTSFPPPSASCTSPRCPGRPRLLQCVLLIPFSSAESGCFGFSCLQEKIYTRGAGGFQSRPSLRLQKVGH